MVILPSSDPVKSKQDQITEKAETGLHFFCSSTNFWGNWVLILYFKSFTEILDQNTLCSIVAACYKSNHLLIFNLICFCIIIQTWICSEYNVNHKTRKAKKNKRKILIPGNENCVHIMYVMHFQKVGYPPASDPCMPCDLWSQGISAWRIIGDEASIIRRVETLWCRVGYRKEEIITMTNSFNYFG